MRIFSLTILFLFIQLFAFSQEKALKPSSPQELGRLVLGAFQTENFNVFKNYIFTDSDINILAKKYSKNGNNKLAEIEQLRNRIQFVNRTAQDNFNQIIKTAKQSGINWQKVEFVNVAAQEVKQSNLKISNVIITCKYKNKLFAILLNHCYKSNRWLMLGKARLLYKR